VASCSVEFKMPPIVLRAIDPKEGVGPAETGEEEGNATHVDRRR
jgi:hypothetical protein